MIEEDVNDFISNWCVDCELVIEYCTWMCFLGKQLAREPKRLEISLGWDFTMVTGLIGIFRVDVMKQWLPYKDAGSSGIVIENTFCNVIRITIVCELLLFWWCVSLRFIFPISHHGSSPLCWWYEVVCGLSSAGPIYFLWCLYIPVSQIPRTLIIYSALGLHAYSGTLRHIPLHTMSTFAFWKLVRFFRAEPW